MTLKLSHSFTASRNAGLARLAHFLSSAGRHYQNSRNTDFGPLDRNNVSVLSPYIRHRLISEEEVLQAVLDKHKPAACEKFVQEVFWRSYFKGHLETRPMIWQNYRSSLHALKRHNGLLKAYTAACSGCTGIECFDVWIQELVETGYLHNHTRMWFASIWIFTLRLPWELGADFMYRHLLDGDPASNTLSWRWVAGLHTKGKTYLARADNIATYTQGRFNPSGLAVDAVALEENHPMPAQKIPPALSHFPSGKIGLLITEEDLCVETLAFGDADVIAVAGAHCVAQRSQACVSQLVSDFTLAALNDGLVRAGEKFKCEAKLLSALQLNEIGEWAKVQRLQTIATSYAPVGPVADIFKQLTADLKAQDISLVQVRRGFDSAAWPHGSKGFFAMKEKIPMFLDDLMRQDHPQLTLL